MTTNEISSDDFSDYISSPEKPKEKKNHKLKIPCNKIEEEQNNKTLDSEKSRLSLDQNLEQLINIENDYIAIPMTLPKDISKTVTFTGKPRSMKIEQVIPYSNQGPKLNCCPFCFILHPRLDRHYLSEHKDEEEVKKLAYMDEKACRE